MAAIHQVRAVLERTKKPLAIHEIRLRIISRFGVMHSECSISARIRELRRDLEREGKTIYGCRAAPGRSHWVYSIVKL